MFSMIHSKIKLRDAGDKCWKVVGRTISSVLCFRTREIALGFAVKKDPERIELSSKERTLKDQFGQPIDFFRTNGSR
jgi:hypothetical protein